jgi:hypothetical protein
MKDMRKYIRSNIEDFQVLSIYSNKILPFSYKGNDYIVKKQVLSLAQLSPFWQMMKDVFDSDFTEQRACMNDIGKLLAKNPHIRSADLVMVDEEEKYQVFHKMPGNGWEPDEFPEGKDIAYQLGQFIGYNHNATIDNYELPGRNVNNLNDRIINYMEHVISLHWKGEDSLDVSVREYFKRHKAFNFPSNGDTLIMTDISANQFLFEGTQITACVDLDAYVIGPKEWELSLIENCVKDMTSFIKGYEQYQSFPNMDETKESYMFLMALGDVWEKQEMQRFMSSNATK